MQVQYDGEGTVASQKSKIYRPVPLGRSKEMNSPVSDSHIARWCGDADMNENEIQESLPQEIRHTHELCAIFGFDVDQHLTGDMQQVKLVLPLCKQAVLPTHVQQHKHVHTKQVRANASRNMRATSSQVKRKGKEETPLHTLGSEDLGLDPKHRRDGLGLGTVK